MNAAVVPPLLVFCWGNPSRGDDALGPLFAEHAAALGLAGSGGAVEFLTDFQLQVEHALDLVGREQVLFVDASRCAAAPFEICRLQAAADHEVTTHAMSPAAVMQVFERLQGRQAPPSTLLAIRGEQFTLGESLSEAASGHLALALAWYPSWLAQTSLQHAAESAPCTN